ncbi:unnamed protein product, partial [Symbiodinium microadriaticum]
RLEWRKEVDSRLSMIKVTNLERAALIRDNNTLRTTVECGRTAGMSHKLRKRIASERKERVSQISDLQTEVAQLEAELRVALEEDKQSRANDDNADDDDYQSMTDRSCEEDVANSRTQSALYRVSFTSSR